MSSIANILSQFPHFQDFSSNAPLSVKTQQFQAQAKTSTSTHLNFVTAEGDRVSLSTSSAISASLGTYSFQGLAEGQAVTLQSQQFRTSTRSDFNLVIDGDLNEQEREDIKAFLNTVQALLQELKTGNGEGAEEAALSLGELDSLASASLFYQQETTVSLEARSTQVVTQGDRFSQNARGRGLNAGPGNNQAIGNFFDNIQQAQGTFQIDPAQLSKRIPAFLNTLARTLEKPFSQAESPRTIFDRIQEEFLKALLQAKKEELPEPETSEEFLEEASNPASSESLTVKNSGTPADLLNESQNSEKATTTI